MNKVHEPEGSGDLSTRSGTGIEFFMRPPQDDGEIEGETEAGNDKADGERICAAVTAKLWETAWEICSERFYFNHAIPLVLYELRDTWMRIFEATYMDETVPPKGTLAEVLQEDEPPLPPVTTSVSTDAIFNSVRNPIPEIDGGAGGEPLVVKRSKRGKKKNKSKRPSGKSVKKTKSKNPRSRKRLEKAGNKGESNQEASNSNREELRVPVPSSMTKSVELNLGSKEQLAEITVCPPKPPKWEWEVIFKSNKEFFMADDQSSQNSLTTIKGVVGGMETGVEKISHSCRNSPTYSKLSKKSELTLSLGQKGKDGTEIKADPSLKSSMKSSKAQDNRI